MRGGVRSLWGGEENREVLWLRPTQNNSNPGISSKKISGAQRQSAETRNLIRNLLAMVETQFRGTWDMAEVCPNDRSKR